MFRIYRILAKPFVRSDSSVVRYLANEPEIKPMSKLVDDLGLDKPVDYHPLPTPVTDVKKAQSFDDVPGPKILRDMSKLIHYIPSLSTNITASTIQYMITTGAQLVWGRNSRLIKWMLDEYGPIVRLQNPFGGDIVLISKPEYAEIIFQNEGPFPIRSSLDCIEKYRIECRNYEHVGPFSMHGPEWEKVRNMVEGPLRQALYSHHQSLTDSCNRFIERVKFIRNRQEEMPNDFYTEIYKWNLESLTFVAFNDDMKFLDKEGLRTGSEASCLLNAITEATEAIRKCEEGLRLWKFFENNTWKSLVRNLDIIDSTYNKYIGAINIALKEKDPNYQSKEISLVEALLTESRASPSDILTILVDMTIIGVNATSHAVAFLLYFLARHPRIQRTLHAEVKDLPPNPSFKDYEKSWYLQACIKESLRMKPPIPILTRILQNDVVLNNYLIPRNTYILIATHLASLREEQFENATKFAPHRWLSNTLDKEVHALASIPFGYGPKACLARNLAMLQISALITKIVKNFYIEYNYGDISANTKMLSAPNRPLKFRFINRN